MRREERIRKAYQAVGSSSGAYDGMMTQSSWLGRLLCKWIWDLDEKKGREYIDHALFGIPEGFRGRLLEVPVGTGCLTLPRYLAFPGARITCLDYVDRMLDAARQRSAALNLGNVSFLQGDVGRLPFEDGEFDIVLTLNGLHVFPDKEAAFRELFRVLKPGGIFCGTCYVAGRRSRTDFFVRNVFVRGGFFTPPFHTAESLREKLETFCCEVKLSTVEAEASFVCRKE